MPHYFKPQNIAILLSLFSNSFLHFFPFLTHCAVADDDDVVVDDEGLDLESDDKNLIEECTELGRRVMDKSCIETLIITLGEYTYLKIHEFKKNNNK